MTDSLQQSGGWAALARLTGLFEWTAVGSILLFFTLVVTIGIASASTRNLLKQERAVLSHIRRMMQSVSALQLMAKMLFEKQLELKDFAEYDSWSHLYVEFDNIDLLTLPTENSMQAVSDGRSYLKWLSDIYSCGKRTAEIGRIGGRPNRKVLIINGIAWRAARNRQVNTAVVATIAGNIDHRCSEYDFRILLNGSADGLGTAFRVCYGYAVSACCQVA